MEPDEIPPPGPLRPAYAGTARLLRERCGAAELCADAFRRPLQRCDLARCHGTCCAHGTTLNAEEALVVRQLVRAHGDAICAWVPDLPEPAVVTIDGVTRTAVKPRPMHALVADYPAHFPDTACAFLDDGARCALQRLADAQARHPWIYKPLACWLHPISVSPERIDVPGPEDDPYPGGFASVTHCGRDTSGGAPAHAVLAPELQALGALLDRDLLAEAGS